MHHVARSSAAGQMVVVAMINEPGLSKFHVTNLAAA